MKDVYILVNSANLILEYILNSDKEYTYKVASISILEEKIWKEVIIFITHKENQIKLR